MSKTLVGVIVTVLALAAIAGVVAVNNDDSAKNTETTTTPPVSEEHKEDDDVGGETQATTNGEVKSGAVSVNIANFAFEEKALKVKKGTKVIWTNQDTTKHDVTPDSPSAGFQQSQLLDKGENYEVTFNTVGTFSYFCSPHPQMKGTIEVVE